tara:strand:+ start:2340 stop:2879 length:540 start_codon:yes stop_codon:yes gene_type:complete
MFILNGSRLAQGTAFTVDGIQYPANWLNLTTLAEKLAIGITEVAEVARADDRFYWDGDITNPKALEDKKESDENGNPLYVKVLGTVDGKPAMVDSTKRLVTKGLKSNFIAQIKTTAGSLLSATDWMVIRKAERDVAIPADVVIYRAEVVAKANELETTISAVTTAAQLAALNLSFPSKD